MSHRPTRRKAANRLRKIMRNTPPLKLDLVQWLIDRGHAQTKGAARKLILDGKVRHESHVLGRVQAPIAKPLTLAQQMAGKSAEVEMGFVVDPYVDASLRKSITVLGS